MVFESGNQTSSPGHVIRLKLGCCRCHGQSKDGGRQRTFRSARVGIAGTLAVRNDRQIFDSLSGSCSLTAPKLLITLLVLRQKGTQRYAKGAELLDFAGIPAIIDCGHIDPATVAGRADSLSGREGGQVPWLDVLPLNMIRGSMI